MAHDWDYWRHKYITGGDDVTLEALSLTPNAPNLRSLKRKSSAESWTQQRRQFRHQSIAISTTDVTTQAAIAKVEQLIDAAEVITRHSRIARMMQAKLIERMKTLRPDELTPQIMAQWLKIATDIERLAIGLETERTSVSVNDKNLSDERDRIRDRSPEELAREYREAL